VAIIYEYKKLRGRIVEVYGSQVAFAAALNISKQALSRKLTCKTGLSQKDIAKWSELLGINRDEYGVFYFA